ncbi:MAG: divalent-cation tolerance protein CutA [Synergistaceae bacterium]|nr:divalent-cation tolerance protein CutA [Synergistaceae bacterium]
MSKYILIISTCADKETGKAIAKALVETRLAACVQMFPIESVYLWKDKICDEGEIMLFIKSKADLFDKISATIKENHPYEIPEIILVPIRDGLPEYLNWIDDCTE